MGYYVNIMEADFLIPTEHLDAAYRAMCDLNARDDLKTGGSWSGGKQTEKWFAWMPSDYPSVCPDAASIFEELGFDVDVSKDGLRINYYGNKTGAEEHFLNAVAPYVVSGSYIRWKGEDGALWSNNFVNGKMISKDATIQWI